jgi:Flavin reductase like domain
MHVTSKPGILYFGTPVVLNSTTNGDGSYNLAPVSSAFWLGWRCLLGLAGTSKTTQNIMRTGECVLNLPSVDNVAAVNLLARTTGSNPVLEGKVRRGYRFVRLPPALPVIASSAPSPSPSCRACPGHPRRSTTPPARVRSRSPEHLPAARTPNRVSWPGIGCSEERPFFDGLCPALTENSMISMADRAGRQSIDPPARHSYIDVQERTPTTFGASEDV